MLLRDLLIVYRAEFVRRLRSRPFLIGLLIGGLGLAGLARLPAFMNEHVGVEQGRIVLAGAPSLRARAAQLLSHDFVIAAQQESTTAPPLDRLDRLGAGRFLALSADGRGLKATMYSTDPASVDARRIARLLLPLNLQLGAHLAPATAQRLANFRVAIESAGSTQSVEQAQISRGVTFTLIFFLYLLVLLNSQLTMAGVIEEKTNRIAELLVSSVDPLALLYGKILAGASLGLMQMVVWMLCAIAAGMTSVPGNPTAATSATPFNLGGALAGAVTPSIGLAFVFFLLVGLLQFSTLFAGIGSLISRPEDLGSINAAMILPIISALIIAIAALDAPNAPVVVATGFIPLLAPFTMFARIATDQPPLWQILLSGAVNALALVAIAVVAGRLYRVGMLLYGRPPTLRQVWTTLRTP
ncbi:MAG: ABC transporter permease [Candidatus Eremiobacteraeota bacterium]|nr:ABC transporter permease [Candidatus Eremiobacteraeota bacterium]MBV8720820.1 ABC transporter permease [Candidatus Eremiobacteraeota bacterium]